MSTGGPGPMENPYKAGGDLSDGLYKGVEISGNETVNYPDAADTPCAGVLQDKPAAAGRGARVATRGPTKAKFGATLTAGQKVYMAASGWFGKMTSGYIPCGQVMEGANSGYIGKIDLQPNFVMATNCIVAGQV